MLSKLLFFFFFPERIAVLPVSWERQGIWALELWNQGLCPIHSLKDEAGDSTAIVLSWLFVKTGRAG